MIDNQIELNDILVYRQSKRFSVIIKNNDSEMESLLISLTKDLKNDSFTLSSEQQQYIKGLILRESLLIEHEHNSHLDVI